MVLFDIDNYIINEKKTDQILVKVSLIHNKMFPLDVSSMEKFVFVAVGRDDSSIWHLRFGHLNIKGLKLSEEKGMVSDLPKINSTNLCEGYIFGKQTKRSFSVGKSWRATHCLELIHDNLCGLM